MEDIFKPFDEEATNALKQMSPDALQALRNRTLKDGNEKLPFEDYVKTLDGRTANIILFYFEAGYLAHKKEVEKQKVENQKKD